MMLTTRFAAFLIFKAAAAYAATTSGYGETSPAATGYGDTSSAATGYGDTSSAATYAGTNPPAATASATVQGTGTQYTITVGANGTLTYDPQFVSAKPQDTIIFQFRAKNHTVTQSSFDDPCRKLEFTSSEKGFDSGFMPVANGTTTFPTFNITVQDSNPIWVYCRQVNHCGLGMVFAVNPPSAANFSAFVDLAKKLNGTSASSSSSPSPSSSSPAKSGAVRTVRASTAFATFLVVGGLSVLTL